MSLRHPKIPLKTACLIAIAAIATAASHPLQLGSASSEMIQAKIVETDLAFRGSGRFDTSEVLAYRASGRFNRDLAYRGSERGVETLAYRASGRLSDSSNHPGEIQADFAEHPASQSLAYRGTGRLDALLLSARSSGRISEAPLAYRGSERGLGSDLGAIA